MQTEQEYLHKMKNIYKNDPGREWNGMIQKSSLQYANALLLNLVNFYP